MTDMDAARRLAEIRQAHVEGQTEGWVDRDGTPRAVVGFLLDYIDTLKLSLAWTETTAEGRGEENERLRALRAALVLIANGQECSNYTKGTCRSGTGRTKDARYTAGRWCDTCIANDALTRSRRTVA